MITRNDYSWEVQKGLGEQGVLRIIDWLYSLSRTTGVWDVQDEERYQAKDIDLLVTAEGSRDNLDDAIAIEVKTDFYTSGNFYFETVSNVGKDTLGCFLKTDSEFIFYYFIKLDKLYILRTGTVQEWFLANKSNYEEKHSTSTDGLYSSKGYAIPILHVPKTCIQKIIHITDENRE